jgi:hypothetical protein
MWGSLYAEVMMPSDDWRLKISSKSDESERLDVITLGWMILVLSLPGED